MDVRRIDLGRARREAKALLAAARAGEPDALARIQAVGGELRLSDAQLAVARELGEPSWPALVRQSERESASRRERAEAFVRAATSDRVDHADALLESDPAILRTLPAAALVVGAPVDVDPRSSLPPLGWKPLLYVTHSRYLGGARSDALVVSAERLLDAGADPNASYSHPEFGAQSVLYGAAGVAHEPRLTRILLARGADPDDGESLYHATETSDLTCVRLLLEAGATVSGTNALAHALDREDGELVSLLLDHVPPAGTRWDELDRAVPWAIYRNRSAGLVRMLAERGANLGLREARTGRRPYALAIARGRPDIAEVLAELGAPREASPMDLLVGDCLRGDREAAMRSARDPELVSAAAADLARALVIAAGEGRVEATALLLDVGAPIDARGELGGTALHHAAWRGRGGTVDLLLRRGADPLALAPEPASGTPLAWAAHGSRHAAQHGDAYLGIGRRLVSAGDVRDPALADGAAGALAEWLAGRDELDPAPSPGPGEVDYGEISWRLEVENLRLIARVPGVDMRELDDGFAVRTGVDDNTLNGVVSDAHDDIAGVLAWLDGSPAQWHVGARNRLHARLVAAGARPERSAVVMGASSGALELLVGTHDIRPVANEHESTHGSASARTPASSTARKRALPTAGSSARSHSRSRTRFACTSRGAAGSPSARSRCAGTTTSSRSTTWTSGRARGGSESAGP